MSRVDELLDHAKARVHTSEIPFNLHPAAEQRRLKKQFVLVVVACSALLVTLGMPASSEPSLSITPKLGHEQLFALVGEEQPK